MLSLGAEGNFWYHILGPVSSLECSLRMIRSSASFSQAAAHVVPTPTPATEHSQASEREEKQQLAFDILSIRATSRTVTQISHHKMTLRDLRKWTRTTCLPVLENKSLLRLDACPGTNGNLKHSVQFQAVKYFFKVQLVYGFLELESLIFLFIFNFREKFNK